ncbi:MAG: bifunctional riboflavin kinase/FAD synthetase [Deltaproteobacteria bacterium]|nr:bifunctional riboflavin kinase/FAD synthetase [Deltaproteobacteria bacterium]
MKIYSSSFHIKKRPSPVVAIGNFDGVHLGHKKIFKEVIHKAKKIKGTSVVYTLYPPPSRVLHPKTAAPQMNTLKERLALIQNQGIDVTVVEKFNRKFSQKTAARFFQEIIVQNLNAKILYVGYNFFFGKGRQGNTALLKKLCKAAHIELHIAHPFKIKGQVVSSSKIRALIQEGAVKKASQFLGRPTFLQGKVIQGKGRGKTLGIPTANIQTQSELIPKEGVYVTLAQYKGTLYPSVTNIGHAPTFAKKTPFTIETHILDFHQNIYGKSLILHFLHWLRPTQKFSGGHALKHQIAKDIALAKKYFQKRPSKS